MNTVFPPYLRRIASTALLISFVSVVHAETVLPLGPEPQAVSLANGDTVTLTKKIAVNIDLTRDFHGPSVVRTANGELLLFHQDSLEHEGGDALVCQLRSTDNGRTWTKEKPAADWRARDNAAMFGEAGLTSDGRLVMWVQVRKKALGGDEAIGPAWLQQSKDHGRTWIDVGQAFPPQAEAAMNARSFLVHGDKLYVTGWSSKTGAALFASPRSDGLTWTKVSDIFPRSEEHPYPYQQAKRPMAPFYPNICFCPDGSVLAVIYSTSGAPAATSGNDNVNWARRSTDEGRTWGPPEIAEPLRNIWAPRLRRISDKVIMITGRDISRRATVASFSTDSGRTWSERLILDKPEFYGSYAYSDSIEVEPGKIWVFLSSPQGGNRIVAGEKAMGQHKGKGDIIGVLLEHRRK